MARRKIVGRLLDHIRFELRTTDHTAISPVSGLLSIVALWIHQPDDRLLKRVFDIDLEHCPRCGGPLKIIAAIEYPPVIAKILAHLGLPARARPRSPAGAFNRFQLG